MDLADSGSRTDYGSGAVREIGGKGRCDLMPLDIVQEYLEDAIIRHIQLFTTTGNRVHLYHALDEFSGGDKYTMLLEASKQFEDGANKYVERNWEKGLPLHCYIDSALRHYLKFKRGDTDEPHDRAFVWNILAAAWTQRHRPEYIDLLYTTASEEDKKIYSGNCITYEDLSKQTKEMYGN